MSKKNIFMGTTQIPTERSAGEITSLLVRVGASQIATEYAGGKICGLRFVLSRPGLGDMLFALPARTAPVYQWLSKHKPHKTSYSRCSREEYEEKQREEAERIGWRQLFRWVEAQIALMDLGMVSAQEVFLPYLTIDVSGQTLFQRFEGSGLKMIAGKQ